MSEHLATVRWHRTGDDFQAGKYSRVHSWTFDGGVTVPASSSPSAVRLPYSDPAAVDPEEAFIASVASCHMLTYLWLASKKGFVVDAYEDTAVGVMTKNERGVPWVSTITLTPRITYGGDRRPSRADEDELHHGAHEQCFIANSIKTDIVVVQTPRE